MLHARQGRAARPPDAPPAASRKHPASCSVLRSHAKRLGQKHAARRSYGDARRLDAEVVDRVVEQVRDACRVPHTAYDPQGPIAGAHAKGYALAAKDTLTDTTAWHLGKGADGAIVTDAKDEARFLTAFTNGTLLDPSILGELGAGDPSGCSGPLVHIGSGAGDGFKSDVVYAVDGSRVAVLLLNGVRPGETGFARSAAAAGSLYCAG